MIKAEIFKIDFIPDSGYIHVRSDHRWSGFHRTDAIILI